MFPNISEKDIAYALGSREGDFNFSSFVNLVVQSTLHNYEGLVIGRCSGTPIVTLFGNDLRWALRDIKRNYAHYGVIYDFSTINSKLSDIYDERNGINAGSNPQPQHFVSPGFAAYLNASL